MAPAAHAMVAQQSSRLALGLTTAVGMAALALRWRRHRRLVAEAEAAEAERVLAFWFGGPAAEAQRGLWFAPAGSAAQAAVDAAVLAGFDALVACAAVGGLDGWLAAPRSALALILLLDQLARHLRRARADAPAQPPTDARALAACEAFVRRGWHEGLGGAELVFALMPLRHSPTPERLERVLALLDAREAAEREATETVTRFRRATVLRLQHLGSATKGDPLDILEHQAGACDYIKLRKEPLYLELCAFLAQRGALSPDAPAITISLSGGVDSMVIALLAHAAATAPINAPERRPPA
ncbi:hypothetical protein T492DRAFT_905700, partial [Pavlovales sp. CCMP2436]